MIGEMHTLRTQLRGRSPELLHCPPPPDVDEAEVRGRSEALPGADRGAVGVTSDIISFFAFI